MTMPMRVDKFAQFILVSDGLLNHAEGSQVRTAFATRRAVPTTRNICHLALQVIFLSFYSQVGTLWGAALRPTACQRKGLPAVLRFSLRRRPTTFHLADWPANQAPKEKSKPLAKRGRVGRSGDEDEDAMMLTWRTTGVLYVMDDAEALMLVVGQ